MSAHSRELRHVLQPHVDAWCRTRGALALLVALLLLAAAPAVSDADTILGSLQGSPTVLKTATADSVYWTQTLADGSSGAAPSTGTVKSVTIKGNSTGSMSTILVQVLRPQPNGSVLVVETSQPFTLPSALGTYTFEPTGMTVQPGDFIGIATLGGSFMFATNATGATTNDFTGHLQDMNGDALKPTSVEPNVALLLQVDLVPLVSGGGGVTPPPSPPCKCVKLTVFLNHFHIFGRGSTAIEFDVNWQMTCSPGAGNCAGRVKVLAPLGAYFIAQDGKLFAPPQPRIATINCPGPCNRMTKGKAALRYLALLHVKGKKGKTHTLPNPRFTPEGRANKSFEIRLSVLCTNPVGQIIKLRVTFDKHGQVDYKKSFLTGPG
jgi:hypothetical protein